MNQSEFLRLWNLLSGQGYPPSEWYGTERNDHELDPVNVEYALNVFLIRAEFDTARKLSQQLLDWASSRNNEKYLMMSHLFLGKASLSTGYYDSAMDHFIEARNVAIKHQDEAALWEIVGRIGIIHQYQARYDEALEAFTQNLEGAKKSGGNAAIATALSNMASVHATRHDFDKALPLLKEQCRLMAGNALFLASAFIKIGNIQMDTGRWEDSMHSLTEAVKLSAGIGDFNGVSQAKNHLAELNSKQGKYRYAIMLRTEQRLQFQKTGERRQLCLSTGNLGFEMLNAGEYPQAFEYFQDALLLSREMGARYMTAHWLLGSAMALVQSFENNIAVSHSLEEAKGWLNQAVELANELKIGQVQFYAAIYFARVDAAEGNLILAKGKLETLLTNDADEEHRAELHYWIWKIGCEDSHQAQALARYTSLREHSPKFEYVQRLAELRGEPVPKSAEDVEGLE